MKIILGCDECGLILKNAIRDDLLALQYNIEDVGIYAVTDSKPYYNTAVLVARRVVETPDCLGILCCGTGMGMAIVANKIRGAYAAVCENPRAARQARQINNANILTFGEEVTTSTVAKECINAWLETEFAENKIDADRDWYTESMRVIQQIETDMLP